MNKNALIAISGITGLGAGVAAGYVLAKKLYFESRLTEEVKQLHEYLGVDEPTYSNGVEEEKPNVIDDKTPLAEYYENYSTNKVDYTKTVDPASAEEEYPTDNLPEGYTHLDPDDEEVVENSFSQLPRPISESDYGAIEDYSCVELGCNDMIHLFTEDDEMLSPNDIDRFVGLDFASYLEDGQEILYMRNDLYETDYKIVFDLDSYGE